MRKESQRRPSLFGHAFFDRTCLGCCCWQQGTNAIRPQPPQWVSFARITLKASVRLCSVGASARPYRALLDIPRLYLPTRPTPARQLANTSSMRKPCDLQKARHFLKARCSMILTCSRVMPSSVATSSSVHWKGLDRSSSSICEERRSEKMLGRNTRVAAVIRFRSNRMASSPLLRGVMVGFPLFSAVYSQKLVGGEQSDWAAVHNSR